MYEEHFMKWFGSGKKNPDEERAKNHSADHSLGPQLPESLPKPETDIVVYGLEDDPRSRALRELLDESGFAYRDERVDEDLDTRAWLQRTTGNDVLPKLFLGTQYCGTYEDIQALAFSGELKRILSGEAAKEELDQKRIKAEMSVSSIIQLLKSQDSLIINEDGVETETWLEPPHQPTLILWHGEPYPIDEMKSIIARIVERHKRGEISLGWRSDQG
jgi:glutaredoxin